MIYADASEYNAESLMPEVPGIIKVNGLEKISGADFLLTNLRMPPNSEHLLRKHMDAGGILVQRKSGNDLVNSVQDGRLFHSLAKMVEYGYAGWQRLLLTTGTIQASPTGFCVANGVRSESVSYISVIAALDTWCMRGGVCVQLNADESIPDFLLNKERKMAEINQYPERMIFEKPLQRIIGVRDWRVTLATFPMIGEKKAVDLADYLREKGMDMDLFTALCVLTSYDNKPHGIGDGISQLAREWLGIPEGWELTIKERE